MGGFGGVCFLYFFDLTKFRGQKRDILIFEEIRKCMNTFFKPPLYKRLGEKIVEKAFEYVGDTE